MKHLGTFNIIEKAQKVFENAKIENIENIKNKLINTPILKNINNECIIEIFNNKKKKNVKQ